jgi:Flp pilus assembly protein TadG
VESSDVRHSNYIVLKRSKFWRSANGIAQFVDASRNGVAATEFAVTIPLLLLLTLACADFGRIAYYDHVVSNAARTGAELGAMRRFTEYTRPDWEASVRQGVLREMHNLPEFHESELTYELATTTDSDGIARVSVELTYPFQTVVAWPGLPAEVPLHEEVEFRQFR